MGIRTVELFAGVGGFRLGLENTNLPFETVWWNQWEPSTKVQHAWQCYVAKFHDGMPELAPEASNTDIMQVDPNGVENHDLLVGGFPCQDYSVATTLDKSGGLQGKKGVLWWAIRGILDAKRPPYVLLENVDRLLKSPAKQRGRDFAVLLACFRDLGYVVEWRVINAAEYGHTQRRRRTFIFTAHESTGIAKHIAKRAAWSQYLHAESFFAHGFPTDHEPFPKERLDGVPFTDSVREVSASFEHAFQNAGVLVGERFWTRRVDPRHAKPSWLGKHVEHGDVPEKYFIDEARIKDWRYQKGPKSVPRTAANGHTYNFTEGGMQFPDLLDAPARTVLTSEANRTPNRSTHVIEDPKTRRLRFLTPLEVERVMGFDDNWTESLPERWRYFTMGNALVVPVVTTLGHSLAEWIKVHEPKDEVERLLDAKPKRKAVQSSACPRTRPSCFAEP